MADKTLNLNDVKDRPLDDLLNEVVRANESITVILEGGQAVEIRPMGLKPLPVLEGSVPAGWKDGIYAR